MAKGGAKARHKLSGKKNQYKGQLVSAAPSKPLVSYNPDSASDDGSDGQLSDSDLVDARDQEQDEEAVLQSSSSESEGELRWGRSSKNFYKEGDSESASEAEEDELAEASRLQREREAKLSRSDFEILGEEDEEEEEEHAGRLAKPRPKSAATEDAPDQDLSALASEAPEVLALLGEMHTNAQTVNEVILPILERLDEDQANTSLGVSYLETKLHLLLSYTINVAFYLMLRAESGGARAESHPVVSELVRIRTLMDKLRPVDLKLKHQMDELIKSAHELKPLAAGGAVAGQSDDDAEDDTEHGNHAGKGARASQLPPSLNDLQSSGSNARLSVDAPPEDRNAKRQRKRLAKVRDSDLLKGLRDEFSEAPTEVVDEASRLVKTVESEERRKYEEENFTRLPESKKERSKRLEMEKASRRGGVDFVSSTDFRAIENLLGQQDSEEEEDGGGGLLGRRQGVVRMVNEMEQARKASRRAVAGGDDDVAPRSRAARDAPAAGAAGAAGPAMPFEDASGEEEQENPYYLELSQAKKRQREERKEAHAFPKRYAPAVTPVVAAGAPRQATRGMIKNRGLTPHKSKDAKNPRKHIRDKYEKKVKARKGQVRDMRTGEGDAYKGEGSGIRSALVRSRVAGKI
jgi:U3 small nucleolar RNA-associated protein 3